jgi:eukaryotic-like serine/threonine-protein kinase
VDVLAGRYELGEPLGGGGTSWVVAGHDRVLTRAVAVKLLAPGCPAPVRERFTREGRTAARVTHPNVVAIYDVGEDAGRAYLVMELVDGGDLASLLTVRGPLPVGDVVRIGDQALAALAALHGHGIVHRDVKPANLLLTRDGTVKLTDFGIARFAGAASLTTGSILGTPAYLPPEQAEGRAATAAGDLYSLGVVCFEMLTGAPPFDQGGPAAVALAHIHQPLPRLTDQRADVPGALASVVERALEKDPMRRWPDAATMRDALVASGRTDDEAARGDGPTPAQRFVAVGTTATMPPTERSPALAVLPSTRRFPAPAPSAPSAPARPAARGALGPAVEVRPPAHVPARPGPAIGAPSPRARTGPGGPGRRRGRWVALALLVVVAAAIAPVAFAILDDSDDGDDGTPTAATDPTVTQLSTTTVTAVSSTTATTAAPSTAAPETTAPPTSAPTSTSPTSPSTLPSSLDELIAVLEAEPQVAGARGEDLLDRLDDVQRRDGDRQRSRAEDALEDIDEWVDDGELDPTFAAAARAVLEPIAASGPDESDESDEDKD